MKRPSMPADLRERYGPVVPTWELRTRPTPLMVLREGGPDTPKAVKARRRVLLVALAGRWAPPPPPPSNLPRDERGRWRRA